MPEESAKRLISGSYTLRMLEDGSVRVESYADPYADVRLEEGVTLVIPDFIESHAVHEIGPEAFAGNQSIRCVILPRLLTAVSSRAFSYCPLLETVGIPVREGDIRLSEDAFTGSPRLRCLIYPDNVTVPVNPPRKPVSGKITESLTPTDHVYSPVWGHGHVDKRETENAIWVTFEDGVRRGLSYSYHRRRGNLIYIRDEQSAAGQPVKADTEDKRKPGRAKHAPAEENRTVVWNENTPYMTDEGFPLSDEQAKVYELLNTTRENYLVTGKAGTGKSVLLRYFVQHSEKKIAVVAFTGVAALNARGQTIHTLFSLDKTIQIPERINTVKKISSQNKEVLSRLDALVIDEVSMVRVDMMHMMDAKLRYIRNNPDIPFGGCQIIAFGDLYQLPPVVVGGNINKYLTARYGTVFFFGAPALVKEPLKHIELVENQRQKSDQPFLSALNSIRLGEQKEAALAVINTRVEEPPADVHCVTVVPGNDVAKRINAEALDALSGKAFSYDAEYTEDFFEQGASETCLPAEMRLTLKVGAMVMMIHNDWNHRWVNGTMAVITDLDEEHIEVEIDGIRYQVDRETWVNYEYKYDPETRELEATETGAFTQYPVRLAYAITIHKSQGQTYDRVRIDYAQGRPGFPGQTYVALSRCRSLSSVYLTEAIQSIDIKVNEEVRSYLKKTDRIVIDPKPARQDGQTGD